MLAHTAKGATQGPAQQQSGRPHAVAPRPRRVGRRQALAVAAAAAAGTAHAAAERVQLGSSDLLVSKCCLGTMTWCVGQSAGRAEGLPCSRLEEYGAGVAVAGADACMPPRMARPRAGATRTRRRRRTRR